MKHLQKNSVSKIKVLVRETSVYSYYVELKEDALINHKYFDLAKLDIFVDAGQFLKEIRRKKRISQRGLAVLCGVSPRQICRWENGKRLKIPQLVEMGLKIGIAKHRIFREFGKKIRTKISFPVTIDTENPIAEMISHMIPHEYSNNTYIVSLVNASEEMKNKIKEMFGNLKFRNNKCFSKDLYQFLTNFFHYKEIPKIQPPLTSEVKLWYENNVNLKRAVIIPSLQSDGCVEKNYSVYFCGNNKILHDYFLDAMHYTYNDLPSFYFTPNETTYTTGYRRKSAKKIIDEVMNLAGNTKTSPANEQTAEEYYEESQPHLDYLLNAPIYEQQIALRIFASTEGCISISIDKTDRGRVRPFLQIACAHPGLVTQLQQIALGLGINFSIGRSRDHWSGIVGLRSTALSTSIEFLKIGGFIQGIKISSRSPHYEGIDKDVLLLGILEFRKRQKTDQKLLNLPTKNVHNEINKIIKKREYKPANYYINYFS